MSVLLFLSGRWRTGLFAFPFGLIGIFAGFTLLTGFGFAISVKDASFYKDKICNTKMAGLGDKTGSEVARQLNLAFVN
jgi:hypothetical protein